MNSTNMKVDKKKVGGDVWYFFFTLCTEDTYSELVLTLDMAYNTTTVLMSISFGTIPQKSCDSCKVTCSKAENNIKPQR